MSFQNGKFQTNMPGINLVARSRIADAVIRFDQVNTAPTTTSGHRYLYVNSSNQLIYDNGSTTLNISTTVAGAGTSLDGAYDNGASITIDTSSITLTQTLNDTGINLNKTATGAGVPLLVQNAGTGDDLNFITTRATSTGIVWDVHHDSASPADADVIFELQVNGEDDGSAKTEYGRIRFLSDDVTDATEDASFQLALFVAGTQRTCLSVVGSTVTIGDNNSNATLTSGGNFDLVLQTGNATTGSITIVDGDNANIQIAPAGTGILDLNSGFDIDAGSAETCTITVTGTTGDGLAIDSSTITSGAVVMINHSSAATLSGGQLLDLQIGGVSYYTFGEVAFTIVGTAGSNSFVMDAGDAVLSDASLAITDADNAATFSVTNNTATTASVIVIAGSGAFTGSTTSSFMTLTASGLTSGTVLAIPADALTTGKIMDIDATAATDGILLDITGGGANMTATGRLMTLTMGAATVGRAIEIVTTGAYTGAGVVTIVADSATTSGATVGQGIFALSADALTTGTIIDATSTSIVLTTGRLADLSHISGNITGTLDKTGDLVSIVSTRTVTTGTVSDDFDMASLIRTDVINGGGTFAATGSVLYIENAVTNTSGTVTDTVKGIEMVMDSLGTGDGLEITHNAVAGIFIDLVGAATTTGKGIDMSDFNALTTGIVVHIASSATAITGDGRMLRVDHTGATGGSAILSEFASAANDETVVLRVTASDALALGNIVDISGAAMTTGTALDIGNLDALTSGKGINLVSNSADTGAFVLLQITNDNASATGASLATLKQDSTGTTMTIDHNGITGKALFIDAASTTQTGGVVDISVAALTTGTALDIGDADALTTGKILNLVSNSATTDTRTLIQVTNDNTAATGVTLLNLKQDAVTSTNFSKMYSLTNASGTVVTIYVSNGTTPNGNLTGSQGDLCLNGDGSGNLFRCSSGTTWVSTI